jgi:uncharacterized protein (TIGR00255 family)
MLKSMTGYGSVRQVVTLSRGRVELSIELKSINSKFLDLNLKMPRFYAPLESRLATRVRDFLKRGRVDVFVNATVIEGEDRKILVNPAQAQQALSALQTVATKLQLSQPVDLNHLMAMGDWWKAADVVIQEEEDWAALEPLLVNALANLNDARAHEGRTLAAAMREHLAAFRAHYEFFRSQSDVLLDALKTRVRDRLKDLMSDVTLDANRLEQEIVFWVGRSDFREELDRLGHHLQSISDLLDRGVEAGRKLEFVLQELHRETNTLGSKLTDARLTSRVVEMKTNLERMKEQSLNIE